jgi:hypothetical protein
MKILEIILNKIYVRRIGFSEKSFRPLFLYEKILIRNRVN